MDMKGSELAMVADHMGHSVNIHTKVYKLQQNLIERTKVAKILVAVEQGTIHKFTQPTTTDKINISDIQMYEESKYFYISKYSFLKSILCIVISFAG